VDAAGICRKNLHERLGIHESSNRSADQVSIEISKMTESLDSVVRLAKPRLIMGGLRYASGWEHKKLMNYMQEKLSNYMETGNFEQLVDLANFVAVEGELKTHPRHHFNSLDRV